MPASEHPPHTASHSHHNLLRPSRSREILLGNQQVTLLRDPRRVTKPGADDVQWELALEFRLATCPHRMEQSRPTRDASAAKQSRHLAA
ncbi:MAG: hypothetical protein RIS70_1815 [Planctomycetota bacterium]